MPATLQSPSLAIDITDDATLRVSLGNKPIAIGRLTMVDAQPLFDPNFHHNTPLGSPEKTTVHDATATTCRIIQRYASQIAVEYTLTLAGEDLTVVAHVTNDSAHSLTWVRFDAPTIAFSRNATGTLPSWHEGYLQHVGAVLVHPSYNVPFGGVYATDGTIGVGCSTVSHLLKQSMFMANFVADGIIPQNAALQFFAELQLETRASKTVDFTLRFSATSDWKHLLDNYRRAYSSIFPSMQYNADHRPWMFSVPADRQFMSRDNPLGYHGNERRFDTGFAPHAFITQFVQPAAACIQGVLLWNPQGCNPRGGDFRPDFDCWPPIVTANLPTLVAKLKSMDLRVGLCARPSGLLWPTSYTKDDVIELDGRNGQQMAGLLARFDHTIAAGFAAYYLDSFGLGYNDYLILRQLREHIGPDISMFSEYSHDLTIPYCGREADLVSAKGEPPLPRWMRPGDLEIYRWLMPEFTTAIVANPAVCPLADLDAAGLTPMIEDYAAAGMVKDALPLAKKYAGGAKRS